MKFHFYTVFRISFSGLIDKLDNANFVMTSNDGIIIITVGSISTGELVKIIDCDVKITSNMILLNNGTVQKNCSELLRSLKRKVQFRFGT
jgi:hypothetical protein